MIIIKTYWKGIVIAVLIAALLLGIIYVFPLDHSVKVGAASIIVSALFAILFSDVAGTLALRRFQEEDAKRARIAAFQSLVNEIARIRELTEYYKKPFPDIGVPKMPMTAFETAFVSGSPGLVADEGLVKAVSEYLVRADIVNSVIDMYLILIKEGRGEFSDITRACDPLSKILDRLDECLKRELKA